MGRYRATGRAARGTLPAGGGGRYKKPIWRLKAAQSVVCVSLARHDHARAITSPAEDVELVELVMAN